MRSLPLHHGQQRVAVLPTARAAPQVARREDGVGSCCTVLRVWRRSPIRFEITWWLPGLRELVGARRTLLCRADGCWVEAAECARGRARFLATTTSRCSRLQARRQLAWAPHVRRSRNFEGLLLHCGAARLSPWAQVAQGRVQPALIRRPHAGHASVLRRRRLGAAAPVRMFWSGLTP